MSEHDKLAEAIKEREIELLRRDVGKLLKENWQLGIERDEARAEVERLKHHIPDATKMIRPEPSRIEIAAMFYSAALTAGAIKLIFDPDTSAGDALAHADALIAASKEDVDEATA